MSVWCKVDMWEYQVVICVFNTYYCSLHSNQVIKHPAFGPHQHSIESESTGTPISKIVDVSGDPQ